MAQLTRNQWVQRCASLSAQTWAFIDGEYCDAAIGETFVCVSPIDGRLLGRIASASS